MNYPEEHPLHDRDAEWIAARAEHVAGFNTHLMTEIYAALAHEYRRLKAKFDGSSAIDISLLNEKARNRIKWLEDEVAKNASAPPSDWLTRAIEAAGAPEDSDWAGLLEHIDVVFKGADKLRSRAEEAEEKLSVLTRDDLPDYHGILSECSFSLGMKWGDKMSDAPEFARKLRERAEAAEYRVDILECRIYTGNPKVDYNDKLEADLKHATDEHNREAKDACNLRATVERMKREQRCREARLSELEATPTQTDLSRIAAALETLANA